MTSLLKRIEKRMTDPKLNANFNREVSKERIRPKGLIIYENLTGTEKEFNFWNKICKTIGSKMKRIWVNKWIK